VIRQLGPALAAGLLSAILFLSLVKGVAMGIVLSYVAPMPLMMAGLGLGMGISALAGVIGALAVAAVVGSFSILPFAIVAVLPALVVSKRALLWRTAEEGTTQWYPPGMILAWLTATGLALLLSGAVLVSGHPEGIRAWVAEAISHTLTLMAAEVPAEARAQAVKWWTPLFPAMICGSWLMMAVVNATGAQGLLVRLSKAIRPSPAYGELSLPDWLALILAVSGLAALVGQGDAGYVAANVAVLALIPFALLGMTSVHRWAATRPNARLFLAAAYGLLFLAFLWAALAVAGLGLVRFWTMRFRRHESGGGMEG